MFVSEIIFLQQSRQKKTRCVADLYTVRRVQIWWLSCTCTGTLFLPFLSHNSGTAGVALGDAHFTAVVNFPKAEVMFMPISPLHQKKDNNNNKTTHLQETPQPQTSYKRTEEGLRERNPFQRDGDGAKIMGNKRTPDSPRLTPCLQFPC